MERKMGKMTTKRIGIIVMSALFAFSLIAGEKTRTVVDMAGRKVEVPLNVERVACISGPSYEKVFLLGEGKKIIVKNPGASSSPWALKTNENGKNIIVMNSPRDPNVEELIKNRIQVVFYWDYPAPLAKLESAGLTVVVTQISTGNPDSVESFKKFQKKEVMLFGEVLGEKAKKKAVEWCEYFDRKVEKMTSKTSGLPEKERYKVYYLGGPDALGVFARNSYPQWYIDMAGGVLVSKDTPEEMDANVSVEQALKWDPDFIFMGRVKTVDVITADPKWSDVTAVKNKNVFLSPDGIMFWDYGSEGVLLMEFIALKLHPGLFKDVNMVNEVKDYYGRFYGYKLSDDDAKRILAHLPPA
jgi:iron complex transport system substrate-binding protein